MRRTTEMSAKTHPEVDKLSTTIAQSMHVGSISNKKKTFNQRTSDVFHSFTTRDHTDAIHLSRKMKFYSTMRIHLKHVQYALEEEKRNSFYKELSVYFIFLFLLILAVCNLDIQVPFEHNDGLYNIYFNQEFPNRTIKKSFHDVECPDDMWEWFQDVLLPGYYSSTQLNSYRISSIQIRFSRVQAQPCSFLYPQSLMPTHLCFPTFEAGNEETSPYGDNGYGELFQYETGLTSLIRSQQYTPNLWNSYMEYGTGGYTVYIPRDNSEIGMTMMNSLMKSIMLPSTRYVVATWSLYNPSSNALSYLEALFEISSTDRIESTHRLSTFHIQSYNTILDFLTFQNILMVFLLLVTIGFISREIHFIHNIGIIQYISSIWKYFDIIQLIYLFLWFYIWFNYLILSHLFYPKFQKIIQNTICNDTKSASSCFVDLGRITKCINDIYNTSAIVSFISITIIFKYLRLNRRLNMLWETLRLASKDLIAFFLIFFLIFFGYSIMGYLLFGTHSKEYRSISDSLISCFQMLFGSFDYTSLSISNPIMSGIFFFSFMIFVYLIIINMFVAILSDYYTIAKNIKNINDIKKINELNNKKNEIEYDIIHYFLKYYHELKWNIISNNNISIIGNSMILLIDSTYYNAEKIRLRQKFKKIIFFIRICIYWSHKQFLFPIRITDSFSILKKTNEKKHINYSKFPVTFLPLYSKSAIALTMIQQLDQNYILDLDDGSLTFDQISLEILGPQELYLTMDETNDSPSLSRPFGLHYNHPDIGSGDHIKCCRVHYRGEYKLNGDEICKISKFIWLKYFGARMYQRILSLFSTNTSKKKTRKNRLLRENDIARIVQNQLVNEEITCRFDQLVREFRLILAKKAREGTIRIPQQNFEKSVIQEAIAFVERFPKALVPLDKRELVGYKYNPTTTDTSSIRLPNSISLLSEFLAENAHEVWSESRIAQGWKWGPQRDNDLKLHPDLLPYSQLPESAKQYDREASLETLKTIQALGYIVNPIQSGSTKFESSTDIAFGQPVAIGETYIPRPIETSTIELSNELNSLVELLAENAHDIWAKKRIQEGWVYGPRRNDATKEHDGLVPYVYLTSEEKDMDRNTAIQTVKCILHCGFTFQNKRVNGMTKFRMFNQQREGENSTLHIPRDSNVASELHHILPVKLAPVEGTKVSSVVQATPATVDSSNTLNIQVQP